MAVFQLKTFKDIINAIREELKIQDTSTIDERRIKRDINLIYEDIISRKRWWWLRKDTTLQTIAVRNTGTASVTQNERDATLTEAPTYSVEGFFFSIDGSSEIYKIKAHSAGSSTITLETQFNGETKTSAGYKIWTDALPLPSDCQETIEVYQNFSSTPLRNMGLQEFRRHIVASPKSEGRPQWYTTTDFVEPSPYETVISSLTSQTRSSDGLLRTLIFDGDVTTELNSGDRIKVRDSGKSDYNGEFKISSITSTNTTNDTIKYTATTYLEESSTSDNAVSIQKLTTKSNSEKYRELLIHPAIDQNRTTLHIDYIVDPPMLENDADEPLMPMHDRIALLYGGLYRAWTRERDPDEAQRNLQLYEKKVAEMEGKFSDSVDTPQFRPSPTYLNVKRRSGRNRGMSQHAAIGFQGGSSGQLVTGTANRVSIFNDQGEIASSDITTENLNQLSGITSPVVGSEDNQDLLNKNFEDSSTQIFDNGDNTKEAQFESGSISTNTKRIFTFPDASGTFTLNAHGQTLSNKTLDNTNSADLKDNNFTIEDDGDSTKKADFEASSISTSTTRTFTFPDESGTLALESGTQTLQNKTIDNTNNATLKDTNFTLQDDGDTTKQADFELSGISNSTTRTYTLPDADDTITVNTTGQTLKNKTLDNTNNATLQDTNLTIQDDGDNTKQAEFQASSISTSTTRTYTFPDESGTLSLTSGTQTISNKTIDNSNSITVKDTNFTLQDDGDTSKQADFELSGLTTSTTRSYTLPDISDTLTTNTASQTLTNKTIDADNNTVSNLEHGNEVDNPTSGVHGVTGNVVGTSDSQTLSSKTLDNTNSYTIQDNNLTLQDNSDNTKQANLELSGITTSTTRTYTLPDVSDTLTANTATQTLTNKTLTSPDINDPVTNIETFEEQVSTPSTPSSGDLKVYAKDDKKVYKLDSTGAETELGAGGGTGLNWIDNSTFDTDTSGWSTYADTAQAKPVDGTGGTPSVSISRTTNTSEQLDDNGSLAISKPASDIQGEGVSVDFSIDRGYAINPQMQTIEFLYDDDGSGNINYATSSSDGDWRIWVYDRTNSQLVQQLALFTLDGTGYFKSQFQPVKDVTDYRLIFHFANTHTDSYDLFVDQVQVGPSEFSRGFAASDAKSFSPVSNISSNIQAEEAYWWRRGDTITVQGGFELSSQGPSTVINPHLPNGLNIDSNKISNIWTGSGNDLVIVGSGYRIDSSNQGNNEFLSVFYDVSSGNLLLRRNLNNSNIEASGSGLTNGAADDDTFSWQFTVPIAGWSSETAQSTDASTRNVYGLFTLSSDYQNSTNNPEKIPFDTAQDDTHAGFDTVNNKYVNQVPGYYNIRSAIRPFTNGGEKIHTIIRVNGSDIFDTKFNLGGGDDTVEAEKTVYLEKGDEVEIYGQNENSTGNELAQQENDFSFFSIERSPGPAVINAAEIVALEKATLSADQTVGSSSTATVAFDTVNNDTHNAFDTSNNEYIVPSSGWYSVDILIGLDTGNDERFEITLVKNGTNYIQSEGSSANLGTAFVSVDISTNMLLEKGDVLRVDGTNPNGSSRDIDAERNSATSTYFSIARLSGVQ